MTRYDSGLKLKRLTFVGHSLGGIIIRQAVSHLSEYQQFFHGYVSLGTPHLGFLFNSSTLIDAGMWVLKKWTNS